MESIKTGRTGSPLGLASTIQRFVGSDKTHRALGLGSLVMRQGAGADGSDPAALEVKNTLKSGLNAFS
jgi:hypothetical protein